MTRHTVLDSPVGPLTVVEQDGVGLLQRACLRHEPTVRATRCIAERLRIRGADISFGPTALSSRR